MTINWVINKLANRFLLCIVPEKLDYLKEANAVKCARTEKKV